jgi:hypothetical protein
MKKILVVAFCLLVGSSVSAQEEAVVGDVQDGAAATIVDAPIADSAIISAPQEVEAPAPVVVAEDSETAIAPEVVSDAAVVEGTTETMPLTEASVVSGFGAAVPCTGCGQAQPVMNYNAGMGYVTGGATYAQAAPYTDYGTSVMAAPAAPVAECCDSGTSRQGFRSRVSTRTSFRDRRNSRRNPCCY